MNELNELNIPAYQRKRSINAKERKIASGKKAAPKKRSTRKKQQEQPETNIPIRPNFPSDALAQESFNENKLGTRGQQSRQMVICGTCDGYFEKINVAVVNVTKSIHKNDILLFETNEGLFEEEVKSMQYNKREIVLARIGLDIGLKVSHKPKVGGYVYKVI